MSHNKMCNTKLCEWLMVTSISWLVVSPITSRSCFQHILLLCKDCGVDIEELVNDH